MKVDSLGTIQTIDDIQDKINPTMPSLRAAEIKQFSADDIAAIRREAVENSPAGIEQKRRDDLARLDAERAREIKEDQQSDTQFNANINADQAKDANPDDEARINYLANKYGELPDVVRALRSTYEDREKMEGVKDIAKTHPKTAEVLQDPDKAKLIVKDDLNNVKGLEDIFKRYDVMAQANFVQDFGADTEGFYIGGDFGSRAEGAEIDPFAASKDLLKKVPEIALTLPLTIAETFASDFIVRSALYSQDPEAAMSGQIFNNDVNTTESQMKAAAEVDEIAKAMLKAAQVDKISKGKKEIKEWFFSKEDQKKWKSPYQPGSTGAFNNVLGGVESGIQMGLYGQVASRLRSALMPVLMMGYTQYGETLNEAIEKGFTVQKAAMAGGVSGAAETLGEVTPFTWFVKDVINGVPFLKMWARQIGTEGVSEVATTLVQHLVDTWVDLGKDAKPADVIKRYFGTLDTAIFDTIAATAVTTGLMGGSGKLSQRYHANRYQDAVFNTVNNLEDVIKLLNGNAKESKLSMRDKDTYRNLVNGLSEGSKVENAYISREALIKYCEENNIDIKAFAEEFGIENLNQTDEDFLRIPIGTYQSGLSGSDHALALTRDTKLSENGKTVNERIKAQEDQREAQFNFLKSVRAFANKINPANIKQLESDVTEARQAEEKAQKALDDLTNGEVDASAEAVDNATRTLNQAKQERINAEQALTDEKNIGKSKEEIELENTIAENEAQQLADVTRLNEINSQAPTQQEENLEEQIAEGEEVVQQLENAANTAVNEAEKVALEAQIEDRKAKIIADKVKLKELQTKREEDLNNAGFHITQALEALDIEQSGRDAINEVIEDLTREVQGQLMQRWDKQTARTQATLIARAMSIPIMREEQAKARERGLTISPKELAQKIREAWDAQGLTINARARAALRNPRALNQFIGIGGAERLQVALDGKETAANILDNYDVANRMEKEGKTVAEIKLATGWERGADGQWRYEVSDNLAKIQGLKKLTATKNEEKEARNEYYWASEAVKSRESNIAELERLIAEHTENGNEQAVKSLSEQLKTNRENLVREKEELETAEKNFNIAKDKLAKALTLGSILNHPELYKAHPDLANIKIQVESATKMKGYLGGYNHATNTIIINERLKGFALKEVLMHEVQHAIQYREGFATGGNEETVKSQLPEEAKADGDSYELYRNLMGEVEARNATRRLSMTPEERLNSPALTTEDVARESQLYLRNKLMGAMLGEKFTEMNGIDPETYSQSVLEDYQNDQKTERKPSITKAEREIINAANLTKEERKAVIDDIINVKMSHRSKDGWEEPELMAIEDGKAKFKAIPYSYEKNAKGEELSDKGLQKIADNMVDEVVAIYKRAQEGDESAIKILREAGWYRNMRGRLREEFGGFGDFAADLLGATSPNTPVRENWKLTMEFLSLLTSGKYDDLMKTWEEWDERVTSLEKQLSDYVDSQRALLDENGRRARSDKAISNDEEYKRLDNELTNARKEIKDILPLKGNDKKYGMNGGNIVRAFLNKWREVKSPDATKRITDSAPKAINFSGNLIGYAERATIDVWAARLLNRMAGRKRIPSRCETGVSGTLRMDENGKPKTSLQFGAGQEIFKRATEKLRSLNEVFNDPKMDEFNENLLKINDDDLQAVAWFIEKEIWAKNGWTTAEGEGGSFEFEANLEGNPDKEEINRLRSKINSKKTPPEIKKALKEKLESMKSPVGRYLGALSIAKDEDTQGELFSPEAEHQATVARSILVNINDSNDENLVIAARANTTYGVYEGSKETSFDIELSVRDGYNPDELLSIIATIAKDHRQDSAMLHRVLKEGEEVDPLRHRPMVEYYFREALEGSNETIKQVSELLESKGVLGYTFITDGRRNTLALNGVMPKVVGVRFNFVPEFTERFGGNVVVDQKDYGKKFSEMSADEVKEVILDARDWFDRVADELGQEAGVTYSEYGWTESAVLFYNDYDGVINGGNESTGDLGSVNRQNQEERLAPGPEGQNSVGHQETDIANGPQGSEQKRRSKFFNVHYSDTEPDSLGNIQDGINRAKAYAESNPTPILPEGKRKILEQSAWHGSPHRFTKFTTSAIGTGEGFQAHGWGLYFAFTRETGEEYRNRLSKRSGKNRKPFIIEYDGQDITMSDLGSIIQDNIGIYTDDEKQATTEILREKIDDTVERLRSLNKYQRETTKDLQDLIELIKSNPKISIKKIQEEAAPNIYYRLKNILVFARDEAKQEGRKAKASDVLKRLEHVLNRDFLEPRKKNLKVAEILEGLDPSLLKFSRNEGQLYEVDVPENDVLLNEDLFFKDQPEKVKQAVRDLFNKHLSKGEVFEGLEDQLNEFMRELDDMVNSAFEDYAMEQDWDELPYTEEDLGNAVYGLLLKGLKPSEIENETLRSEAESLAEIFLEDDEAKDLVEKINDLQETVNKSEKNIDDVLNSLTGLAIYRKLSEALGSDKEASLALNDAGVKGIAYDGIVDGECVVVFDDAAVEIINTYYQGPNFMLGEEDMAAPHGNIEITDNGFNINLFETANFSTFSHEVAHMMLETYMRMAAKEDASEFIKGEVATIREYLGIKEGQEITEEQHETFARSFEAYLMEGKSPAPEMRGIFARFKNWMIQIYNDMRNLDVKLSQEIREVFDRMLATDEEIAAVNQANSIVEILTNGQVAGIPDDLLQKLAKLREDELTKATDELRAEAMEVIRRRETQDYQERLKAMKEEVAEEFDNRRAGAALKDLTSKDTPRDSVLGLNALLELGYTLDQLESIQKQNGQRIYHTGGTSNLQDVAEFFGYDNVRDMIDDLAALPNREEYIDKEAKARLDRDGDILQSEGLAEKADECLNNEMKEERIAAELEVLEELIAVAKDARKEGIKEGREKEQSKAAPQLAELEERKAKEKEDRKAKREGKKAGAATRQIRNHLKAVVPMIIGGKSISEVKPNRYVRAMQKAANDSRNAMLKGDYAEAARAKQRELLNYYLYREALNVQDKLRKGMNVVKRVMRNNKNAEKVRTREGILRAKYIIAKYITNKGVDTYEEMLRKEEEHTGQTFTYDLGIVGRDVFSKMDVNTALSILDDVKAQWDMARRDKQVELESEMFELEDFVDDVVRTKERIGTAKFVKTQKRNLLSRGWNLICNNVNAMMRFEAWCRMAGEPWMKLFNRVKDGANNTRQKQFEVGKKLVEILQGFNFKIDNNLITARELGGHIFGQITGSAKQELIMALLHTGNMSNKERLLLGYGWGQLINNRLGTMRNSLDDTRWNSFVNRMIQEGVLTKEDFDRVQQIWDLFDSLKPEAQKAHREVFGKFFNEITANSFTVTFKDGSKGTYKGGYVPAIYDSTQTNKPGMDSKDEVQSLINEMGSALPKPTAGWGKDRQANVKRPLLLDITCLRSHLNKQIAFSQMAPAITDIVKVLRHEKVQTLLREYDPDFYETIIKPWLSRAYTQRMESGVQINDPNGAAWRYLRTKAGVMIMFGNVVNAVEQIFDMSAAFIYVNRRHLMDGFRLMMTDRKNTVATVMEKSTFMRQRLNSEIMAINGQLERALNPSRIEKLDQWLIDKAYFLQSAVDEYCGPMTWIAAYNQSLEKGMTEKEAIHEADSIVRQTFGSNSSEDVANFEAGDPKHRLFTQFMGYFVQRANLLINETKNRKRIDQNGKRRAAITLLWLQGFFIPAWIGAALRKIAGGGDDDEEWSQWFFDVFGLGSLSYGLAMGGTAGQIANSLIEHTAGSKFASGRIMSPPAIKLMEDLIKAFGGALTNAWGAFNDDDDFDYTKVISAMIATTRIAPLPTAPAKPIASAKYVMDVLNDEVTPTSAYDLTRGVLTGRASPNSK